MIRRWVPRPFLSRASHLLRSQKELREEQHRDQNPQATAAGTGCMVTRQGLEKRSSPPNQGGQHHLGWGDQNQSSMVPGQPDSSRG